MSAFDECVCRLKKAKKKNHNRAKNTKVVQMETDQENSMPSPFFKIVMKATLCSQRLVDCEPRGSSAIFIEGRKRENSHIPQAQASAIPFHPL